MQANVYAFWCNLQYKVLSFEYLLNEVKWVWGSSDQQVSAAWLFQSKSQISWQLHELFGTEVFCILAPLPCDLDPSSESRVASKYRVECKYPQTKNEANRFTKQIWFLNVWMHTNVEFFFFFLSFVISLDSINLSQTKTRINSTKFRPDQMKS